MISLSIRGDEASTDEARSSRRRISGIDMGCDFALILCTAWAICDLKAANSAEDDSAGDPCCKLDRPAVSEWTDRRSSMTNLDLRYA